jgi:hypothetical protein
MLRIVTIHTSSSSRTPAIVRVAAAGIICLVLTPSSRTPAIVRVAAACTGCRWFRHSTGAPPTSRTATLISRTTTTLLHKISVVIQNSAPEWHT